jgi:hypothetical protein
MLDKRLKINQRIENSYVLSDSYQSGKDWETLVELGIILQSLNTQSEYPAISLTLGPFQILNEKDVVDEVKTLDFPPETSTLSDAKEFIEQAIADIRGRQQSALLIFSSPITALKHTMDLLCMQTKRKQ